MSPEEPRRGNKRRSLRVPVQVEVGLGTEQSRVEYAINLSRGGLCLQSRHARARGEPMQLRFRLAPETKPIEVTGEVVWCTCEEDLSPGMMFCEMGVRFLDLEGRDRAAVEQFVEDNANFWADEREFVTD